MYRYRTVPQRIIGRTQMTYGLLAEENEGDKWIPVAVIPDVSCDQIFVYRLAAQCTRGQLPPYQMLDVVMDALRL